MRKPLALLIAAILLFNMLPIQAVKAEVRPAAKDIPIQTLVIGTYLIHLSALDGEVVGLASNTMDSSGQKKMYYKSELAKGSWMDISSSGNVEGLLTTKGTVVTNAEIDALKLTHWAKEPGVIVDLATGQVVTARQISEAVNSLPQGMKFLEKELQDTTDEIKSLISMRDKLSDSDKDNDKDKVKELDKQALVMLPVIASLNGDPGYGTYLDFENKLAAIQKYKDHVNKTRKDDREAFIKELLELETAVMTEEKIFIVGIVSTRTKAAIDKANEEAFPSQSKALSATSATLVDLVNKLSSSLAGPSPDALSGERNLLQRALLDKVYANDFANADGIMLEVIAITNIKADLINDRETELRVLKRVLGKAFDNLKNQSDVNKYKKFKDAKAAGESDVILKKIIEGHAALVKGLNQEIDYLKSEIIKRTDLVIGRLQVLEDLIGKLAASIAGLSAGSGEEQANNLSSMGMTGDEIGSLNKELNELKLSLDSGKLEAAMEVSALLTGVQDARSEAQTGGGDAAGSGTGTGIGMGIGIGTGTGTEAIVNAIGSVLDQISGMISANGTLDDGLKNLKPDFMDAMKKGQDEVMNALKSGIRSNIDKLAGSLSDVKKGELEGLLKKLDDLLKDAKKAALSEGIGAVLNQIGGIINPGGTLDDGLKGMKADVLKAIQKDDRNKLAGLGPAIKDKVDTQTGSLSPGSKTELEGLQKKLGDLMQAAKGNAIANGIGDALDKVLSNLNNNGALDDGLKNLKGDYLIALGKGDKDKLNSLEAGIKDGIGKLTGTVADKTGAGLASLKKNIDKQLEVLKEAYLSAVEKGDLAKANGLKDEINGLLKQLADAGNTILEQLNKADSDKKDLKVALDKAILSGDTFTANNLSDGIALADLTISGLLGQLDDKNKNLLKDLNDKGKTILDLLDQGDSTSIRKLDKASKDLLSTYGAFGDDLKVFANQEGIMDDVLKAMRDFMNTLAGNGDNASSSALLKNVNLLADAAADMDTSLSDRDDATILSQLIKNAPGDATMESLVEKHYKGQNGVAEENNQQAIYRNSFLGIDKDNKPAVKILSEAFREVGARLLIADKVDFAARNLLAVRGREKNLDIDAKKLQTFLDRTAVHLTKLEESLYNEEASQEVTARAAAIEGNFGFKTLGVGNTVFVNRNIPFINPPFIKDDTIFLPIRDLFKGLGGSVVWVGTEAMAAVNCDGMEMKFYPGKGEMVLDGQLLPVAEGLPMIDGRIYIPLSLAEELAGIRGIYEEEYDLMLLEKKGE